MKPLLIPLLIISALINTQRCFAQDKKIKIYSDDFAGASYELGAGKYDFMYLVRTSVAVVKSVKVPRGMKVTLYERDNFEGASLVLTDDANTRYLQAKGFGKTALNISLVVEELPKDSPQINGLFVTIYKDDLAGASKQLATGRYDYFELGDVDNDHLSSLKIPKGLKVTLYEHGGFQGKSLVLTSDTRAAFLVGKKFNDITSSIVIEEEPLVAEKPAEKILPVKTTDVVKSPGKVDVPHKTFDGTINAPSSPIIYQGDYSGMSMSLAPGRYSSDQLSIGDNELSSIKVPKGFRVTLYDGDAFEGRSLVLTQDARASFFADNNFNNIASSLIVDVVPMVTLHEGDYSGVSNSLAPGRYSGGKEMGIGNDQLSSVRVPRGLQVTLYEDEAFQGRRLVLTQDSGTDVITESGFNNTTSSVIVEAVDKANPAVTVVQNDGKSVVLYADRFSGSSQVLTPGKYQLKNLAIGDNDISSAKVPKGMRVVLFEDDNFQGYSLTAEGDIDLSQSGAFDNRTSSVIVEDLFASFVSPEVVPVKTPNEVKPVEPPQKELQPPVPVEQLTACLMTESQFENAYKAIDAKPFRDERMSTAKLATKGKCLTLEQVRSFGKLFMDDDQRLQFVKYAYELCSEKDEYYLLSDVFNFMSIRNEFNQFLKSK